MSRKAFNDDVPLPPHGAVPMTPPGESLMPCRFCGAPTKTKVLSLLGARCNDCYQQFIRLGYSGPHPPRQFEPAPWVVAARAKVIRRSQAHGVLDAARELRHASLNNINAALRETGDLE